MIPSPSSLNGNYNAEPSSLENYGVIRMDPFDFGNHGNLVEPTISLAKERESPRHERQIGVDPISLQQEPAFFGSKLLPPIRTGGLHGLLPPLSPAKSNFLSYSLPNSSTTSPRFPSVSNLLKWNKKYVQHESQAHTPRLDFDHIMMLSPYLAMQQEMRSFGRSKSCGEGRAIPPSVDFDLLATKDKAKATGTSTSTSDSSCTSDSNESECHQDINLKSNNFPRTVSNKDDKEEKESQQEEFKCGALCLFLPGFGKAKPVKSKKDSSQAAENNHVISRTVSLEKFECGSWASPVINMFEIGHEDGAGVGVGDSTASLYFDLPLEMIRSSANDTHSPVTAAFIFDKERKGVLKNGSVRTPNRRSHESSRHVRFSTSSPNSHPASPTSCITPRLRKAREDFNAFLEAQSA